MLILHGNTDIENDLVFLLSYWHLLNIIQGGPERMQQLW